MSAPRLVLDRRLTQPPLLHNDFPLPSSGFLPFNFPMSIGFKEWALVCNALAGGEQSIIIRKGGLHEGRDGFRFEHEQFFLFPTLFHEQVSRLKLPPETPLPQKSAQITIQTLGRCEGTQLVTDLDKVRALSPFHIWKDEVIEERFRYDELQGVHVGFFRFFKLSRPWVFPDEPKYGGCRSWLTLPELPADIEFSPVLDDAAHSSRMSQIKKLLE